MKRRRTIALWVVALGLPAVAGALFVAASTGEHFLLLIDRGDVSLLIADEWYNDCDWDDALYQQRDYPDTSRYRDTVDRPIMPDGSYGEINPYGHIRVDQ